MGSHANGILVIRVDEEERVEGGSGVSHDVTAALGGEDEVGKVATLAPGLWRLRRWAGDAHNVGVGCARTDAGRLPGDVCLEVPE